MDLPDNRDGSVRMHYDAKLGHIEAQVEGLITRFDSMQADLRSSREGHKAPFYVALVAIVTGLVTVGSFALTPVTANIAEVKERITEMERHDNDGHPEAVLRLIQQIQDSSNRFNSSVERALAKDESRVNDLDVRTSVLETLAKERTRLFVRTQQQRDLMLNERTAGRWRADQQEAFSENLERSQQVFSSSINQRLNNIERGIDALRLTITDGQ